MDTDYRRLIARLLLNQASAKSALPKKEFCLQETALFLGCRRAILLQDQYRAYTLVRAVAWSEDKIASAGGAPASAGRDGATGDSTTADGPTSDGWEALRYDSLSAAYVELSRREAWNEDTDADLARCWLAEIAPAEAASALICLPIYVRASFWGLLVLSDAAAPWAKNISNKAFWKELSALLTLAIDQESLAEEVKELRQLIQQRDKQVKMALQLAEKNAEAKSDFLSRMNHELRTPLNAIIGLNYIAAKSKDLETLKGYLDQIDIASKQLLDIVNDVLDMSKIRAKELTITQGDFDLEALLVAIFNGMIQQIEKSNLTIRITIDPNVPLKVKGDAQCLSQILNKLLSNAIKFTPANGHIDLSLSLLAWEGKVCDIRCVVADTGIGISAQEQEKLFASFEQVDGGRTRKYGGTGLGLAICSHLVQLMGGHICVESALGKGSRFIFNIQMQALTKPKTTLHGPPRVFTNVKEAIPKTPDISASDTAILKESITTAKDDIRKCGKDNNKKMNKQPQGYLPYIDLEEGLGRIRNNKKLYLKMLDSFTKNNSREELVKAVAANDFPNIQHHAHSIKGVAANLSFKPLSSASADLEQAMKTLNQSDGTGQLPADIHAKVAELENVYQKTVEFIEVLRTESGNEGL